MKNIDRIINESIKRYLNENLESEYRLENSDSSVELNNFEMIKNLLTFNATSDTYYVEIIQRKKDNPNADFRYRKFLKYYLIHSADDLDKYEGEIKRICIKNDARAYIYMNARDSNVANQYAEHLKKKFEQTKRRFGKKDTNASMYGHELEVAYGSSEDWTNRPICMIDIDSPDVKVHDAVHDMFKQNGIGIYMEYETLNGGLHIFSPDKEKLRQLKPQFTQFNIGGNMTPGVDYGNYNIVGMDIDKPAILYCNLIPQGYQPATDKQLAIGMAQAKND